MAVRRPLKWQFSPKGFREWSDDDLARLSYEVRVGFADALNGGGVGSINVGGSGTAIGDMVDTRFDAAYSTIAPDNDGGPSSTPISYNYPSSVPTRTVTTYNYKQERTSPSMPSTATMNSNVWLYYDSGYIFRYIGDEADILDTVLQDVIAEIKTGDEVGSYRVSTSTPTSGSAGTWSDKGTWMIDTRYTRGGGTPVPTNSGTTITTYKLYLKRSINSPPGTTSKFFRQSGSGIHEQATTAWNSSSNLVTQVLVPALQRKVSTSLAYTVDTSTASSRGSFTDTRLSSTGTFNQQSGQTYYAVREAQGSATNITTKYFRLP